MQSMCSFEDPLIEYTFVLRRDNQLKNLVNYICQHSIMCLVFQCMQISKTSFMHYGPGWGVQGAPVSLLFFVTFLLWYAVFEYFIMDMLLFQHMLILGVIIQEESS